MAEEIAEDLECYLAAQEKRSPGPSFVWGEDIWPRSFGAEPEQGWPNQCPTRPFDRAGGGRGCSSSPGPLLLCFGS